MIAVWMAYTLAIGACATAAAAALEPMIAARGGVRRLAWVGALVATVLVPVAMAVRPIGLPAGVLTATPVLSAAVPGPSASAAGAAWGLDEWLLAAWGLASVAMLGILGASAWQLRATGRRATPGIVDGERVALTDTIGPGALCFGTTRIIIPAALAALDPARRSLLVRHEREHLRAGDPALMLAALVSLAVMPWNAALWFIAARLRSAIEIDCDARVLAAGGDVRTYGDLLLTVAAARRAPRLAAFLAFASSPSPLERRIREMTARRTAPGLARQLSLGLLAVTAVVAACETRRPEPLAPVASYTIADGRVTPAPTASATSTDSARAAVHTEVRQRVPAPALNGNADDPLLVVYDADGTVVLSGRLGAKGANGVPALDSIPFPPEAIASVDVVKAGALLPPEARGGLIRVVLKSRGELPRKRPSLGAAREAGVRERTPVPAGEFLVIVVANDGRELHREVVTTPANAGPSGTLETIPVEPDAIATVEVTKSPAGGARPEVHITLKAGHGLRVRR